MKIFTEAQLPYPVALEKVACMGTYIMLCAKPSAEPVSSPNKSTPLMGMCLLRPNLAIRCMLTAVCKKRLVRKRSSAI